MRKQDAIRDRLLRQLPHHGWRRIEVRTPEYAAWEFRDAWELESVWSPQGARARLYFFWGAAWTDSLTRIEILDPEREESEGEGVHVGHNWRDSLPWVFAALARLRDERPAPPAGDPEQVLDESTWAAWADPEPMIGLLTSRGWADERKLRLFAAGCCRRMGHLMEDLRNARAIEAMEGYADGLAPRREMKKARKAARMPWLASLDPALEARQTLQQARQVMTRQGYAGLAGLVRELFGDPWRAARLRKGFRNVWRRWEGGTVVKMARAIEAKRSYADLPVLADALADAGCEDAVVLDHLRGLADHAPGCWAVDLVLGRVAP